MLPHRTRSASSADSYFIPHPSSFILKQRERTRAFTSPKPRERSRAFTWLNPSTSQPLNHSSSAFTLIELLVVITIIIILMGLLFPAFRGAQDQAKRAQAKNDLTQIVTAVSAFYTEYGRMPIPSSEADGSAGYTYGDTSQGAKHANDWLFNVLRPMSGLSGDQLNENPRLISFITPPIAKDSANPRNGLAQSGVKVGQWCDPWGTPYNIRLDSGYSNWVSTNPPYQNAPTWDGVNGSVTAWSYGKDTKLGANGSGDGTASGFDDVLSWQ